MYEVISFGACWTAWYRGHHFSFKPHMAHELKEHPKEFMFHFGCKRDDLTEQIPLQVTWMNHDVERQIFEERTITLEDLDPKVIDAWKAFSSEILIPAAGERRITWGVCGYRSPFKNYYEYATSLASRGKEVVNYLK